GGGSVGLPDFSQVPQMPQMDAGRRDVSNNDPLRAPQGGTAGGSDQRAVFVKQVLADTEDVWNRVFNSLGRSYREPRLVLFRGAVGTACGTGQSAMGPFYCPGDQKIYIDLSFFDELSAKFGAPGDFAQAYVIAHEVGHHIQMQIGIADQVQRMKRGRSRVDANRIQVRMELQADCLAGVWATLNDKMKNRLEPGDIEEGLQAASAIGDDMIQRRMTGRIVPDAFTHGTSEQRVRWFKQGFETGQIQNCDTFRSRI
ncbi:MAG: neutral zinc metallopeptidase, partial [Pseudomonadota bacterium]